MQHITPAGHEASVVYSIYSSSYRRRKEEKVRESLMKGRRKGEEVERERKGEEKSGQSVLA